MKISQEIYITEYEKALKQNFNEVREKLKSNDSNLMDKISKRSIEYGIDIETLKKDILECDTAIIPFVVNPSKQNIYEKTAFKMIQTIKGIKDAEILPNNALNIVDGVVTPGKKLKQDLKTKTIDFKWTYNKYTIYASHKYTKSTGGAQDNQYKDLKEFIKQSRDNKDKGSYFIAIADGPYYLTYNGKANSKKIDNLKSLCTTRCFACRIEELSEVLEKIK